MFHSAQRQSGYAVILAHDRRKREEGKLCQTCITDKAKAGSSTRFERTLINRVDRSSTVVPHPHEIPFPFLPVGPYPIPCLFQSRRVTALFTEGLVLWQTVPLMRGFSGKTIISSAYLPLFPFHLFFVFHSSPENSPPCQTICMFCNRCQWCQRQEAHVVYYLCNILFTSRLFTLYYVFSFFLFRPWPSNKLKGKPNFKNCRCAFEWLGQKKRLSC